MGVNIETVVFRRSVSLHGDTMENGGRPEWLWCKDVAVAGWFGLRHNRVLRREIIFPARAGRREQPGRIESDERNVLNGKHDKAGRQSIMWQEVVGRVQGELACRGWLWVLYDVEEGGKEMFDLSRE